jgi:Domain of unknown function (DUF2019)
MTEGTDTVTAMRTQYRTMAVDWDAAGDDATEANRLFKAHHALYKTIRGSPDGRQAISGLLDDPVTAVRLLAATHSLQWEPQRAQVVLEEIEHENNLYAVDAKWTLRSYRSGKLNLDW